MFFTTVYIRDLDCSWLKMIILGETWYLFEIGLNLKINRDNQVKLVQIPDTHDI